MTYHADFGIGISRQGDDVILDVTCPSTLRIAYSPAPLGLPWKPLLSHDEAATDLRNMCSTAVLTGSRTESGEVNVPFPDSSVYSNFARKLQPAPEAWRESGRVSKDDLVKFKWFQVDDGRVRRVVGISVYPYQEREQGHLSLGALSNVPPQSVLPLRRDGGEACARFDHGDRERLIAAVQIAARPGK